MQLPKFSQIVPQWRAREKIRRELRLNGVRRWVDLQGRQVPLRLVISQPNCGMGIAQAFARFVRRCGGYLVVDVPEGWKLPARKKRILRFRQQSHVIEPGSRQIRLKERETAVRGARRVMHKVRNPATVAPQTGGETSEEIRGRISPGLASVRNGSTPATSGV